MRKLYLLTIIMIAVIAMSACGMRHEKPTQRGSVSIDDKAKLFSAEDVARITEEMNELAEYGNVCVYTYNVYTSSTAIGASNYYNDHFGTESGFLFFIDTFHREVYVETDGYIRDIIPRSKALTITDNVYSLASDGLFAECSALAIRQAVKLMKGERISERMRVISGIFVAVLAALLINFVVLRRMNRKSEVSLGELSLGVKGRARFENGNIAVVGRTFVENRTVNKVNIVLTILRIIVMILSAGGGGRSSGGGGSSHSSSGGGHKY
jgi:hypothetical protein